jgi:hypothetical protein
MVADTHRSHTSSDLDGSAVLGACWLALLVNCRKVASVLLASCYHRADDPSPARLQGTIEHGGSLREHVLFVRAAEAN